MIFTLFAFLALTIDQITKSIAVDKLFPYNFEPIFGDFGFALVYNTGVSFSSFNNSLWVPTILSAVVLLVVIGIYLAYFRKQGTAYNVSFGLVIGGGLSNLLDRVFVNSGILGEKSSLTHGSIPTDGYAPGGVTDFISYFGYFIGNVADIFVVCGFVFIFYTFIMQSFFAGKSEKSVATKPAKLDKSDKSGATKSGTKPAESANKPARSTENKQTDSIKSSDKKQTPSNKAKQSEKTNKNSSDKKVPRTTAK
jgi:signal peptidase II